MALTPVAEPNATPGNRSWRLRHSAWLLAPVLGLGLFSFVGFVYCAIRIRQRKWTILAGASVGLTFLGWILMYVWTDSLGEPSTPATTFIIELWLASVIVAFVVNRDYLTWRATVDPSHESPPSRRPPPVAVASVVAGWYDDPGNPQRVRYWDGTDWTEHSQARMK